MSNEILDMEARIKDHVSAQFDKIEGKVKHLGGTTTVQTKIMAVGFALMNQAVGLAIQGITRGIGATKAFFKDSVEKYKSQEKAVASLTSALGKESKELEDYASQLQSVTTFGDELIIQAESMIGSFIKEEDQIKRVVKAATDLATEKKMNLLAASDLITKSIASSTNALSRYGINIGKTTSQEERLDAVVNELNKKFGGRAEALAKTDTGKVEQLNNLIGDQQELLGKELLPLWSEWYKFMLKVSTVAIPILVNAAQGLSRFLGGKKEADDKVKELNLINKEIQGLITLQKEWKDIESINVMRKEHGTWYDEDALKEAQNNINTLQEMIDELAEVKPKTTGDTTNTGASKATEEQLAARIKSLEEEVKHEEKIAKQMLDIDTQLQDDKDDIYKELKDKSIDYDQQIVDAKAALRKTEIYGMQDSLQQQYAMLDLESQREQKLAEGNSIALAAIRDKYDLKREQALAESNKNEKQRQDTLTQNEISNMEQGANYTFSTLKQLASATKASSATQKTLDIAQATANVYMGVTKAISQERYWEIPFITALGFAQVANISAQKYAGGGIVPGNSTSGDRVPAYLNSREAVFTMEDQRAMFDMIRRPQSVNNSQAVSLNISVGNGSNYDMAAAQYTVDQLVPVIGDALVRAKNEGRLRQYETSRR